MLNKSSFVVTCLHSSTPIPHTHTDLTMSNEGAFYLIPQCTCFGQKAQLNIMQKCWLNSKFSDFVDTIVQYKTPAAQKWDCKTHQSSILANFALGKLGQSLMSVHLS